MSRICSAVLYCAAPLRCLAVRVGGKQFAVQEPQCNPERAVKVYQTGPTPPAHSFPPPLSRASPTKPYERPRPTWPRPA
ncbi:hypothetical protein GCM10009548_64110 [Streptomyces malaysiensis subsp. malaysiensis]